MLDCDVPAERRVTTSSLTKVRTSSRPRLRPRSRRDCLEDTQAEPSRPRDQRARLSLVWVTGAPDECAAMPPDQWLRAGFSHLLTESTAGELRIGSQMTFARRKSHGVTKGRSRDSLRRVKPLAGGQSAGGRGIGNSEARGIGNSEARGIGNSEARAAPSLAVRAASRSSWASRRRPSASSARSQTQTASKRAVRKAASPRTHIRPPASCWSSSGVGPHGRTRVS